MPIQPFNYAALPTANTATPDLAQSLMQGMTAYNMPFMQKQELEKIKLANALAQIQAQFAPEMTQADLAYKQGMVPNLQAQTDLTNQQAQYFGPNMNAQIGLTNAQTGGQNLNNALAKVKLQYAPEMAQADLAATKTKTALMPESTLASLLSGAGKYNQANWQASPTSQFIRTLNNPQMQNLISSNPQIGQKVTQTLGNIALGNGQTGGMFSLDNHLLTSLLGSQGGGNVSIASQQPGFTPTQTDVQNVMNTAGNSSLKKTLTAQQLNQQMYGGILDNIMTEADTLMPSVTQYAGIKGQAKLAKDSTSAQLGKVSPEYEDYFKFSRTVAPTMANEMRRVLGGQATDYEGQLMKNLANPAFWDSNPQLAMSQWSELKKVYKTQVNKELYNSPIQRLKDQQASMNDLTLNNSDIEQLVNTGVGNPGKAAGLFSGQDVPSQKDLEHTAKKYGLTVEQVKQRLGLK